MKEIVFLDNQNWVTGVLQTDTDFNIENYPDVHKFVEVDSETSKEIKLCELICYYDGLKFRKLVDTQKILDRIRSQRWVGIEGVRYFENVKTLNSNNIYPETESKVVEKITEPHRKIYPPSYSTEILPGLLYRSFKEEDSDIWIQRQIYSGNCSEELARRNLFEWITSENVWLITTEYKGEVLQIENYQFDETDKTTVFGGFASHIDRGRPHWFWTKMAKILFDSFSGLGIEKMNTRILTKYPEYKEFLKRTYGGVELDRGLSATSFPLRYYIRESLKGIPDWPSKRSLQGWKWKKNQFSAREAIDEDIPQIIELLNNVWEGKSRKPLILKTLDKWINLDQATLLLIYNNDNLVDIKLIRQRTNELCGNNFVLPQDEIDTETYHNSRLASRAWQRDAGYKQTSFTFETKYFESVKKMRWDKTDHERKIVIDHADKFDTPYTEVRFNLDEPIDGE